MATTTIDPRAVPESETVPVVQKHHWLVRVTHWMNIPLLLGLILSGLSIYWAGPVYKHAPVIYTHVNPATHQPVIDSSTGHPVTETITDYFASGGIWVVRHVPGIRGYSDPATPPNWLYDHFSLGTGILSTALNLHWLFTYLFILNGVLYVVGLGLGKGYKALLPRRTDLKDALRMQIYYLGVPFAKVLRRPWPHPHVTTKYNALQRLAYFSMPVMGAFSVATGWAIHKPQQLGWLQALFGGYDYARVWHFWLVFIFGAFVVPHVLLVLLDGWDTMRSMVVGWSDRLQGQSTGK